MTNDKSKITNWISCFRTISAHYSPLEFYTICNKVREGVPYQQDFSFRKRRLGWWQYLHLLWINWRSNSNFQGVGGNRSKYRDFTSRSLFSQYQAAQLIMFQMWKQEYENEIECESLLGKVFFHYLLVHCPFLCRSLVEQRCLME